MIKNLLNLLKILGNFIYNGLSKLDPNKDFSLDNVFTCCKKCDDMKQDRNLEEFKAWVLRICNKHNL